MDKCTCGQEHEEITSQQIIDAEMRGPLEARKEDPFPKILGNRTANFGTYWYRGGVLLSDEAAARCADPDELNRAEVRMEGELLRHVKAGLRPVGLPVPEWANGVPPAVPSVQEKKRSRGRPPKEDGRKGRKLPKGLTRKLTAEQRMERAKSAARARAAKAAKINGLPDF